MIAAVAREWRHTGWCAVRPAFASASLPRTEDAVRRLRELGCARVAVAPQPAPRRRTHGDPSGGYPRPDGDGHRQAHVARQQASQAELARRRRSNVLFLLVAATGATLFLAATTKEPAVLYIFAVAFLALCGYVYLLAQARQRESTNWPNDWMYQR